MKCSLSPRAHVSNRGLANYFCDNKWGTDSICNRFHGQSLMVLAWMVFWHIIGRLGGGAQVCALYEKMCNHKFYCILKSSMG